MLKMCIRDRWSAEDPALYELEIELLDDAGHLVEVTGQKVGFRKFELKLSLIHI